MTNQEAKDKICPISRRDCLGDRCAVWEWTETKHHVQAPGKVYQVEWLLEELPKNRWQGRCGFAK